ncbi:MAG: T9SS type A sorting domain-containing protein [Ignavibacteriales bacterium]|nr:T9SS type A sorting domain-containing protein [Ignavibacteriales bacterium]
MKNHNVFIIVLILFLINAISAQNILWKKNFGLSTADDFGRAVIETTNGNICIAGYTGSYGLGGFDVWLIKIDANGDTLWTKTYGGVGDDYAYAMKQTNDGGFIIGGATNSFGAGGLDYYIIKTDSLGDTLWTKTFGEVNDDICWGLEVVEDGYVLAGEKNSNLYLLKTDLNGQYIWERIYGNSGDDIAYNIRSVKDVSFLIVGKTGTPTERAWLLKTNLLGDTLWTRKYGESYDSFRQAEETEDSGLIITGMRGITLEGWNLALLKTDSLGNVEWEKTYDYDNDYDIGYSVQQTIDGGYIVTGGGSIYDWISHGWIIRTNSLGDTLWTKYIEGYPDQANPNTTFLDSYFFSIIQMSNGDYVSTGIEAQAPLNDQIWLVRISSDIVPVELTSFTATAQRNSVSLNWQTATETNNSGFEMQRSQMSNVNSQTDWQEVAFIPGFGTTTEPKSYSFVDENLSSGKYQYRLKQIDFDGSFEYSNTVEVEVTSPTEFSLEQNYPNPFNPTTKIKYTIPSVTLSLSKGDVYVTLKVYDLLGNEIATLVNKQQQPGTYEVEFNVGQAISLSSGVYYYQLRAGGHTQTKKMLLMK